FKNILHRLGLKQPASAIARNMAQARNQVAEVGFPALVRPSFVLGGRAMEICYDMTQFERFVAEAFVVAQGQPVLIDRFLEDAIEVDVDAIADEERVIVAGVMEHIEEAGVHSGDSACVIPPHSLSPAIVDEIRLATYALARRLQVRGLMNIQFAVKHEQGQANLYVLEVNPRASRTVPFVSKATGMPVAKVAAKVMAGISLAEQNIFEEPTPRQFSIKEAVFPFAKFAGIDIVLGPEMKSTGEVMGISDSFFIAFAKSQVAAGTVLPTGGKVFISVAQRTKQHVVELARRLEQMGFELLATRGTAQRLEQAGIPVQSLMKIQQGHPNAIDFMIDGNLQLVINTPSGKGARTDEGRIRAAAVSHGVPCITTFEGATAAVGAMEALRREEMTVQAVQDRFPTQTWATASLR
ncbi:MAG: ATP-grasp domain-containing protein, partial [Planctomycetes bacterium]|nr:ATP-grasp domain-containing protein [Planctomycetota bacterium]